MKRLTCFLAAAFALGLVMEAVSDDARPTQAVAKGPLVVTAELDGSFECAGAFEAKYKPDAYAGELAILQIAEHGKAVKKGDVLVKFDPTPWQKAVAAAENDLRGAAAGLKAAEESLAWGDKQDALTLQGSQDGLMEAEKRLEYWEEMDGPAMLKYNELGLKSFEDNVKDQEQELDQLEKMYKSEELTTDTADIVRDRARRQLENSKIYLEMRRKSSKKTPEWEHPRAKADILRGIEQAKVSLSQTQSNIENGKVQRETQKVRAKMEFDRQSEMVEKLKRDGEKLTITAPAGGWVFYGQLAGGNWTFNEDMLKNLRAGEKAAANMVLLTLIPDGEKVVVRLAIPEDKVLLTAGAETATVTPVAMSSVKIKGKIGKASPIPVGGVYPAWVELAKHEVALVPGMKCKVSVLVADLKEAVTVPVAAVGTEDGKSVVWVQEGGKTEAREVKLGVTNGTVWSIESGLKGGETILQTALKK